jgi:catechol 2,3-dioxygenase-like lactoylglutathione lyase family enzyme
VVATNFDHVTIVVTDVDDAIEFFALLGFQVDKRVVISGPVMEQYMGVAGIEADHVTLVIPGADPRQEIQLLCYHAPEVTPDPGSGDLGRLGFSHVCLRVPDLDAAVDQLVGAGRELRNRPMEFHDRKLVFVRGPSNVVVELAEWI